VESSSSYRAPTRWIDDHCRRVIDKRRARPAVVGALRWLEAGMEGSCRISGKTTAVGHGGRLGLPAIAPTRWTSGDGTGFPGHDSASWTSRWGRLRLAELRPRRTDDIPRRRFGTPANYTGAGKARRGAEQSRAAAVSRARRRTGPRPL
jgi:hypothetical protein